MPGRAQAAAAVGSSWSGPNPARVPRPGHDRHSPAQNKGLHKLHGSEKTNTRATPPHSRPRVDSSAPAASSSSAPYLRLTAINPSVAGQAQIHHEDTPRYTAADTPRAAAGRARRSLSRPRAHRPRRRPHSLRDALRYPDNGASRERKQPSGAEE